MSTELLLLWPISGISLTILLYSIRWYRGKIICLSLLFLGLLISIMLGPLFALIESLEGIDIQRKL